MASPLRLLVAEGNPPAMRDRHAAKSGQTPSVFYAAVLGELAGALNLEAVIDICYPGDAGANPPGHEDLAGYDGVAITGSGLNLWKAETESLSQVDFARSVFSAGLPFFGSCWGLQVAAAAAGGEVKLNPQGREIGLARSIRLTAEGLRHPMHEGRREVFDAPAIHSDEVSALPDGATLTATNDLCVVQAAEIRSGAGVFWGVQFHPEYTFTELGGILTRYTPVMMQEGFFRDEAEAEAYIADLVALDAAPDRKDLAWRLGIATSVLDPLVRRSELVNWLKHQVLPAKSERGRA